MKEDETKKAWEKGFTAGLISLWHTISNADLSLDGMQTLLLERVVGDADLENSHRKEREWEKFKQGKENERN